MRYKVDFATGGRESYKQFKKDYPTIQVEYKQFKEIICTWNLAFANHILDTGEIIKLPYGIGPIGITRFKPNRYRISKVTGEKILNLPIDWLETKKEGRYIYHLNEHTDGDKFVWSWFLNQSYIKLSEVWSLEFHRDLSRKLAKMCKEKDPKIDNYPYSKIKK